MDGRGRNILLVANFRSDTGYAWWIMEHFWCLLADLYAGIGRKVYLAYPEITRISKRIVLSPIEVVELKIPWENERQAMKAKRFIMGNGVSHIYFTDRRYFNLQYARLRNWGIQKILVHRHTLPDHDNRGPIQNGLNMAKNRIDYFCADGVVCVSELVRGETIQKGKVPGYKCHVVQNGVDLERNGANSTDEIRHALGVPDDGFVIASSGRAHPHKRFSFIIECARLVRLREPTMKVVFLIAGDGPCLEELKQQVDSSGVGDEVQLLGFRRDVPDLLRSSNIAMHASISEGFSLSIVEYMAAGLPVLVPGIASVCQHVDHGVNGFIYEKDSCENAVDQIIDLAKNPKLAGEMGRNAQEKAKDYSIERCSSQFLEVSKSVFEIDPKNDEVLYVS